MSGFPDDHACDMVRYPEFVGRHLLVSLLMAVIGVAQFRLPVWLTPS